MSLSVTGLVGHAKVEGVRVPIGEINVTVQAAITEAVSRLSPPSTLLALCFNANAERVSALQKRLAEIETEIEAQRTRRNAAARRLVALAGKPRPRADERSNTVAFPVFQRAAS